MADIIFYLAFFMLALQAVFSTLFIFLSIAQLFSKPARVGPFSDARMYIVGRIVISIAFLVASIVFIYLLKIDFNPWIIACFTALISLLDTCTRRLVEARIMAIAEINSNSELAD